MKYLFILITLSISSAIYCQKGIVTSDNFKLFPGKPYKSVNSLTSFDRQYFALQDGMLSVKKYGKEVTIQKFKGEHLELVAVNTIKLDVNNSYMLEGIVHTTDKTFLIYSVLEKSGTQLFQREIDRSTANFAGKEKLLLSIPYELEKYYSRFSLHLSADLSKVAITHKSEADIKTDKGDHLSPVHVFDANLVESWSSEIDLPYDDRKSDYMDVSVDNAGELLWLFNSYEKDFDQRKKSDAPPKLLLVRGQKGVQKAQINEIPTSTFYIRSARLVETAAGSLSICGYYEKHLEEGVAGVMSTNITKKGVDKVNMYDIPANVITAYESKKQDPAGLKELNMGGYGFDKEGALYIFGQVSKMNLSQNTSGESPMVFGNILTTKINPDGTLAWMKKVPKGWGVYKSSFYAPMFLEKGLYFFLLDQPDNAGLTVDKQPKEPSGEQNPLTAYRLDLQTGEAKRSTVLNMVEYNGMSLYHAVGRIVQLTEHSFAVEVYKKQDEDVIITVEVKE